MSAATLPRERSLVVCGGLTHALMTAGHGVDTCHACLVKHIYPLINPFWNVPCPLTIEWSDKPFFADLRGLHAKLELEPALLQRERKGADPADG